MARLASATLFCAFFKYLKDDLTKLANLKKEIESFKQKIIHSGKLVDFLKEEIKAESKWKDIKEKLKTKRSSSRKSAKEVVKNCRLSGDLDEAVTELQDDIIVKKIKELQIQVRNIQTDANLKFQNKDCVEEAKQHLENHSYPKKPKKPIEFVHQETVLCEWQAKPLL